MQQQIMRPAGQVRPSTPHLRRCVVAAPARQTGARRAASGRRQYAVRVQASAKAADILAKAKRVYESGDRLQAMKLYEDVMAEDPTPEQKCAALYGQTAVHAAFGDVELAQMTLREGLRNGLDYETASIDPDNPVMVASPQITIQLRRFAQQVTIAMANRPPTQRPYGSSAVSSSGAAAGGSRSRGRGLGVGAQDLDSILGSASGEQAEVDTSVGAIIRRVLILLLVGTGLGVGLWFAGLEYLFPKV